MADQNLANYISNALKQGYTPYQIKQNLIQSGWKPDQIDRAMAAIPAAQNTKQPKQPVQSRQASGHPNQQPQQPNQQAQPTKPAKRPTGITIICILGLIGSLMVLVGGVLILIVGSVITAFMPVTQEANVGILSLLMSFLSFIFIGLGAVGFFAYYMLFKMKKIGFYILSGLYIFSIAVSFLGMMFFWDISLIPNLIIAVLFFAYVYSKRQLFR